MYIISLFLSSVKEKPTKEKKAKVSVKKKVADEKSACIKKTKLPRKLNL